MGGENKKLTIKLWSEDDRPREKLVAKGQSALSNAELIAILLSSGTKEMSAVDLAKALLKSADNDLNKLSRMTVNELCKMKGIGQAKAVALCAAMELGRRRKEAEVGKDPAIKSSFIVYKMFAPLLADLPHEEFWMLYLNGQNRPLAKVKISQGGLSQSGVDVRLIVKLALDNQASAAVAIHNHPSGNSAPSIQDHSLTKKIKNALALFSIPLIDHIIISNTTYYSYMDENAI